MKWYQHLLVGLFAVFGILFVFSLFYNLSPQLIVVTVVPLAFGSILPDIDHPSSKVRKIFNLFLLIFSLTLSYIFLSFIFEFNFLFIFFLFLVTIIIFLAVNAIIPRHRGLLHRGVSAVLFGILCFLITWKIFDFQISIISGVCGVIGYSSHLIVDRLT